MSILTRDEALSLTNKLELIANNLKAKGWTIDETTDTMPACNPSTKTVYLNLPYFSQVYSNSEVMPICYFGMDTLRTGLWIVAHELGHAIHFEMLNKKGTLDDALMDYSLRKAMINYLADSDTELPVQHTVFISQAYYGTKIHIERVANRYAQRITGLLPAFMTLEIA